LNVYSVTVYYSIIYCQPGKHNMYIITSEVNIFNFGYLSSEHVYNQFRDINY